MPTDGPVDETGPSPDPDGFVPFDRFMDWALYAPHTGFYARPRSPLGPKGDFYTTAHVSPLYGAALARRISDILASLPLEARRTVVELGPGDGVLASSLLAALERETESRRPARYVMVDRSTHRRTEAVGRARALGGTIPIEEWGSLGEEPPFQGVLLAHEVLDAQPVRRFRREGAEWLELGMRRSAIDGWREATRAPQPAPSGLAEPSSVEEGQTVELARSAEGLVREIADRLRRGAAIFVDYGYRTETEFLARREGTVVGIRAHRTEPIRASDAGSVDLSAFVHWERIRSAAERDGWVVRSDRSLAEALGDWGLPGLLAEAAPTDPAERLRQHLAVKNLLFGFETFRVLEFGPADTLR